MKAPEDCIMEVVVSPATECIGAGIQHMKEGLPITTQVTRRCCDVPPQMQVGIV